MLKSERRMNVDNYETRRIDDLGRIVIPKLMRRELGWNNGDEMEIHIVENGVLITNKRDKGEE